jgi:hypothetical protein
VPRSIGPSLSDEWHPDEETPQTEDAEAETIETTTDPKIESAFDGDVQGCPLLEL